MGFYSVALNERWNPRAIQSAPFGEVLSLSCRKQERRGRPLGAVAYVQKTGTALASLLDPNDVITPNRTVDIDFSFYIAI
jgi:hypothetical protein